MKDKILYVILIFLFFTSLTYSAEILSLKDVILLGIKNNPQIKISKKIKEQYFYQKNVVRSQFFPYIYFEYTFQRSDLGKNLPAESLNLLGPTLNWNIFSGFSKWHDYKSALRMIEAMDEAVKSQILNIALNITNAYLEYFKQKALYQAALSDLEDAKIILKLAKKKYEVGLSPYADVLDAEAKVKEAEFKVINYKYFSEIAKAKVLTLINYNILDIDKFEFLPVKEKEFKIDSLLKCIETALKNRPELKAKNKEILAQKEKVKSAKGEYLPSIDVFANYYKKDSSFFPEDDEEFFAGIKLSIPIFTGFLIKSKIERERAILEQKNFEKNNLELQIKQEVFTNYKNLETAKENYESAQAWLKSMEEDYKIIKEKYKNGLASIVDVTTILARLSEARAQVINSKYDLLQAYYILQKSLGYIPGLQQ
ncbi:MAG: hypothetical protein DRP29_05795 [Thermodesulfobacteriota bacterium]|nr:MAG: hypothetical protein DRP29_05795 [Thermodesulfobacteriota bacterium]